MNIKFKDVTNNELIYNNKQLAGLKFFKKGVQFSLNHEYGKAYEYFKESLDLVTSDLNFNDSDLQNINNILISDLQNNDKNYKESLFVKAILILYSGNKIYYQAGLTYIQNYLKINSDEYGLYINLCLLKNIYPKYNYERYLNKLNYGNLTSNFILLKYEDTFSDENIIKSFTIEDFICLGRAFVINPNCILTLDILLNCYSKIEFYPFYKNYSQNIIIDNFLSKKSNSKIFIEKFLYIPIKNKKIVEWIYDWNNKNDLQEFINFLIIILDDLESFKYSYNFILENEEYKLINLRDQDFFDYENEINENLEIEDDYFNYDEDFKTFGKNEYYDDSLDMDQQSPEFWDNL